MNPSELKHWREVWGFSQSQLATALNVRVTTISRWERGDRGVPTFLPLALETLERRRADETRRRGKEMTSRITIRKVS